MSMSKRVLITGATGFIGQALSGELVDAGYEVVALSRCAYKANNLVGSDVKVVQWDAITSSGWVALADGVSACALPVPHGFPFTEISHRPAAHVEFYWLLWASVFRFTDKINSS